MRTLSITFGCALAAIAAAAHGQTSSRFAGTKANAGTVTYAESGGKRTLSLSADFVVPDTPAPHWQVVDASNNAFLLQRLEIKGGVLNRTVEVPDHVAEVAAVRIWCAFAETLLGEAKFEQPVGVRYAGERHDSTPFHGAKANRGHVTHERHGSQNLLVLSDDFVVPDTPAPHWQVVDSKGNTYLLQRLVVKGDKLNKTIVVPAYVRDVAKVRIWCAFAETLLGEASFQEPVM